MDETGRSLSAFAKNALFLLTRWGLILGLVLGAGLARAAAPTISAGGGYTCAVTSAGAAQCWGLNNVGELGNGNTINQNTPGVVSGLTSGVVAVSAGPDHSCAVTNTGDAQCWGYNGTGALGNGTSSGVPTTTPVAVSGLSSGVVAISAGDGHTCAVTSAGGVWCWGSNTADQLGTGTPTYQSRTTPPPPSR